MKYPEPTLWDEHGGPAFPANMLPNATYKGMTLRDWFAGQALAGLSANPAFDDVGWPATVDHAYEAADAMLAARTQKAEG